MKFTLIIIILCLTMLSLNALTIYELQYTTNAGSGTYPSPYAGQTVTTQGIVTANGYSGSYGYYISMPEGGAWKGILIYDSGHSPLVGTMVEITGQCWEYWGLTEIRNVSNYQVISVNNPIPPAEIVNTAMASTEAYEGVLIKILNATVTVGLNSYNEWKVSDGSGELTIADAFFNQSVLGTLTSPGVNFDSIIGIGNYYYADHNLNPRSQADLVVNSQGVVVSLPTMQVPVGVAITVPVTVSNLTLTQGYQSYSFQLGYNPTVLNYENYSTGSTLSSNGTVLATPNNGNLAISFTTNGILQGQGALIKLNFTTTANGVTPLTASNFVFNSTPVMIINQGLITIGETGGEVLDTLTVIQRPLLNIPAIVIPGENISIECVAPSVTTNWEAELSRGNLSVPLQITSAQYENMPPRWKLSALVPNVPVFELYNLKVRASGGINDRTRNSVQVLPSRKTNYYFAHITDTHLPSHIFYPDAGWDTDSTEMVDLREVINDLNVIRPEFVLLTGDLTNQGPLEDFQNQREYTKAKRLLGEFEIPVYLVAGNHDIGGWSDPPLPAGSARKFWWKNFGWSWLNNTSSSWQYNTQDYSFDYGPVHFTGLEAYDNYDYYLTNIYGSNSFTNRQMQWLQADLAASGASTKVLFHHYDFDDQLNLSALGINMALWGHIHYNLGSTASAPYNLATQSVCDGNRAYRIVRVTGSTVQPYGTLNSGNAGDKIQVSYIPNNYGLADSVYALIANSHYLSFENSVIKFIMPSGNSDYSVTGGVLEQVDRSGTNNICYVKVNLLSYSSIPVTIKATTTANEDAIANIMPLHINTVYPNPFFDNVNIGVSNAKTSLFTIKVFNLKGETVKTLFQGSKASGSYNFTWDGRDVKGNQSPAGIYFIKLSDNSATHTRKIILLK